MPLIDPNNPEPELQANLASLIDLDEPEALLGTLRHVAQRRGEFLYQRFLASQAGLAAPGFTADEAQRWENLAKALAQAELTIEHINAPRGPQSEQNRQGNPPQQAQNAYIAQKAATDQDDAAALQAAIYKAV